VWASRYHLHGEVERERVGVAGLTSPFVECVGERDLDPTLTRARRLLVAYLQSLKASDPSLSVSVYARDLLDGPWMGIDEDAPYEPASLMKIWVLFHALARMEADPQLAGRTQVYPGPESMTSADNLEGRPESERMVPGKAYRFDELLERMVVYSDNHAKDLVLTGVEPGDVEAFMAAVGIPVRVVDGEAVMDARTYARHFRVLYNSSVFSRPTSEYALDLLSRAHFPDGLRASVPPGVTVASKFGMHRAAAGAQAGAQTHECGIIYHPERPFVLCVMTRSRGRSVTELAAVVREVGRIIYGERHGET
jgi:beta-lactamase class A